MPRGRVLSRCLGRFVYAGGVNTWYEEYGSGPPLVMLHGDIVNAEVFEPQIDAFSSKYRLIIPERRGHGRTPDLPGDFSYDIFARDTIAFMDALGLRSVSLVGHSGGAMVALSIAASRPDLVSKLVPVSGDSINTATEEEKRRLLSQTADEFRQWAPLVYDLYMKVTPEGARRFPAFHERMMKLWVADWRVPDEKLGGIAAKTMVMVADHDFTSVEAAAALSRKIPGAQLCVIPGADHGLMWRKPEIVNKVILDFLGV